MKPVTTIIEGRELPLYVLRRQSDKTVIRARTISNTTGEPNPGPDEEYLPIVLDELPTFDPVYQSITRVEGPNEKTLQWEIGYTLQDRTKQEILDQVDALKRMKVADVVPTDRVAETGLLVIAAIITSGKFSFGDEDQADVDSVLANAAKLKANRQKSDELKTRIEVGEKPDIKPGWEVAEVAQLAVAVDPVGLRTP